MLKILEGHKDVVIMKGDGKAFCSGGDLKKMCTDPISNVMSAYWGTYRTSDLISSYSKPYVPLIDGLAMGGAAVYFIQSKYRVATDRTMFAMPECSIGYFCDAGGSFFLPRLEKNSASSWV